MEEREETDREPEGEAERPPGQFMDERLADDTARFLADVKRLAERRREARDKPESWAPPS